MLAEIPPAPAARPSMPGARLVAGMEGGERATAKSQYPFSKTDRIEQRAAVTSNVELSLNS